MSQTQQKLDFAKLIIRYKDAVAAMTNCPSMDLTPKLWIERNKALREAEQALKDFVHPMIEAGRRGA